MKITSFLGVFFFPDASTGVTSLKILLFRKGQIFDLCVSWQVSIVILGFWVIRIDNRYIHRFLFFFRFLLQWDLVGHFISLPSVRLTISYFQFSAINFQCYFPSSFTIHSSRSTHFVFFATLLHFLPPNFDLGIRIQVQ